MSNYDIATVVAERDRLKYELSQAQETIADFRAALEKALWCAENFQAESEEWQRKYHEAKSALFMHPDSTEVK